MCVFLTPGELHMALLLNGIHGSFDYELLEVELLQGEFLSFCIDYEVMYITLSSACEGAPVRSLHHCRD